ncbi:unnamed protein product [Brassicogethes aeneus]|uniref:Uncharacterized protein n=1 Tax=Brassicogethes aeneus TaxID=1431903 RepID=A0A9P0B4B5_BRAAE|nr:unnamed protein product [Brassicogethes aeneus]
MGHVGRYAQLSDLSLPHSNDDVDSTTADGQKQTLRMEVVAAPPSGGGVPPFHDHDVREWSRLDSLTGVLERARLETDNWTANTSNSRHKYNKLTGGESDYLKPSSEFAAEALAEAANLMDAVVNLFPPPIFPRI